MEDMMFDRDVFLWEHGKKRCALLVSAIPNPERLRSTHVDEKGRTRYGKGEACLLAMADPRRPMSGDVVDANHTIGHFLADGILKAIGFANVVRWLETDDSKRHMAQEFIDRLRESKIPTSEDIAIANQLMHFDAIVRPLWSHKCHAHVLGTQSKADLEGHTDTRPIGYALVYKDRLLEVLKAEGKPDASAQEDWRELAGTRLDKELEELSMGLSGEAFNATLMVGTTNSPWDAALDWPPCEFIPGRFYGHDLVANGLLVAVGHGFAAAIGAREYRKGYAKPIEVRTAMLVE